MYALMLTKSADLLATFRTEAEAKKALKKVKGADAGLTDIAIVELGDDGRPVARDDESPANEETVAHSELYEAVPA